MDKSQIIYKLVKRHKLKLILLWLAGLLLVGIAFFMVWLSKLLIDIATGESDRYTLAVGATIFLVTVVMRILISSGSRWLSANLTATMTKEIRTELYERLLYAQWRELSHWKSGDLTSRFIQDTKEVSKLLVSLWPGLATSLMQLIGALTFIYFIDQRITWFVIALLPIVIYLSRLYFKKMRRITHKVKRDESDLFSYFGELLSSQLIVRVFNRQKEVLHKLEQSENQLLQSIRKRVLFGTASGILLKAFYTGGYAVALVWIVYQLHLGLITFGSVVAFLQLVSYIQVPTYNIVKQLPDIVSSLTAIDRLEELAQIPSEEHTPIQTIEGVQAIEAKELRFGYPHRAEVLQGINFRANQGDLIALTGVTGTGKTTIFKILMGLEKPQEGSIELLLTNGQKISIDERCRNAFAYVPQDLMLFSGTIKENLLLGNPKATEEEIISALHMSVADFVLDLPDGLDTNMAENHANMSEGQTQRLSIARAILANRPILLLDEATSALDSQTERQLLANIKELSAQRGWTILFITHNPMVAHHCPRTFQLSHGKLIIDDKSDGKE